MRLDEIIKGDGNVTTLDFDSGSDLVQGLELADKNNIDIIQPGTSGGIPTILDIDRNTMAASLYLSHMRHAGINFEDISDVNTQIDWDAPIMKEATPNQEFLDTLRDPFKANINNVLDRNKNEIAKMGWALEKEITVKNNEVRLEFRNISVVEPPMADELLQYLRNKLSRFGYTMARMEYNVFAYKYPDNNLHMVIWPS